MNLARWGSNPPRVRKWVAPPFSRLLRRVITAGRWPLAQAKILPTRIASRMNWLFRRLGLREREYRGDDFSVRIEPVFREAVSVVHTREGKRLSLSGERIGKKWEGIQVQIPPEGDAKQMQQVVRDLETAFQALRYEYLIARKTATETVPEEEQQAAMAELNEMGYDIEVMSDGKIRQTFRPGAPRRDRETLQEQVPRMMSLLQSLHGARPRFEILAKSKEF